jgi:hypothetical protein
MSKFLANQGGSANEKQNQNECNKVITCIHRRKEKRGLILVLTVKRPKFGFNFPAKTLRAVDFPIPFVPTKPSTCPGLGTGNLQLKLG